MNQSSNEDVTRILGELQGTRHAEAMQRLLPIVYDELRALSDALMRGERQNHTLQATALVHEAYLKLAGEKSANWESRAHFFRVAAKVMRRVLINHAAARKAQKRGGGASRLTLHEAAAIETDRTVDLVALDHAMTRLAERDEQKAKVVELRIFGGCTIEETAESLDISPATVKRDWKFAQAWLRAELSGDRSDGTDG